MIRRIDWILDAIGDCPHDWEVEDEHDAIARALLLISDNVAKHIITRDGWTPDDRCYRIDLREAEEIIWEVVCRLSM